jgi:hypothetical protein
LHLQPLITLLLLAEVLAAAVWAAGERLVVVVEALADLEQPPHLQ